MADVLCAVPKEEINDRAKEYAKLYEDAHHHPEDKKAQKQLNNVLRNLEKSPYTKNSPNDVCREYALSVLLGDMEKIDRKAARYFKTTISKNSSHPHHLPDLKLHTT